MYYSFNNKKYNLAQIVFKKDTTSIRITNKITKKDRIIPTEQILQIQSNISYRNKIDMIDVVFDNYKMNYSLVNNIYVGYNKKHDKYANSR